MIGNAHLDPVWLWRWPAGLAEALLTCRTMADLLDAYPDARFTRSDVWVYEMIEEHDPALFDRIKRHIAAGRWDVVGGWYIQPDCNLPTAASFHAHMEHGRKHHFAHFGMQATVGYNVDSFGHAASLPSLLRANGYDSYVFMRPGPHEKELPANLFRWRSPIDGAEVLTWRIHRRYNVDDLDTMTDYIQDLVRSCSAPGVDHVMCFYGVGDHGGGPTRSMVEWIRANRESISDCVLEFSTPRRFFDAVAPAADRLPVVEDELQMHAIGCYSVVHEIKSAVRRTEHLATAAARVVANHPASAPANAERRIAGAWRRILFNQFHDTFDGTSLPDAYIDARDQLGSAATDLSELYHATLFRTLVGAPDDELQRLMVYNPSESPFDGYVEHEPWLDWSLFQGGLLAPDGTSIPYQVVQQPSISGAKRMILWKADVPAGEFAAYRLCHDRRPAQYVGVGAERTPGGVSNEHWVATVENGALLLAPVAGRSSDAGSTLGAGTPNAVHSAPAANPTPATVELHLIDDESDTWSHDITGYSTQPREIARFASPIIEEEGPLRASARTDAVVGTSTVSVRLVLHAGSPVAELDVTVNWNEKLTIAKLVFSFGEAVFSRSDGIPAGRLDRRQNGFEYPVVDSTIVRLESGGDWAIVAPDAFGIDGIDSIVRYTLLRSPAYAWQGRKGGITADEYHRWTDRGEHRFRFAVRSDATGDDCRRIAEHLHEPPTIIDWTTGMTAERGERPEAAPWTE